MDNHKISFNSLDCQKYRQDHEKSEDEKLVKDVRSSSESKPTVLQLDDSTAEKSIWTKTLRTDKSDKEKNIDNFSDPSCR